MTNTNRFTWDDWAQLKPVAPTKEKASTERLGEALADATRSQRNAPSAAGEGKGRT